METRSDLTTWSDEELVEHALSFGTPTYAELSRRLTEARDSISSLSDFNAELSAAYDELLEAATDEFEAVEVEFRFDDSPLFRAHERLRAAIEQAKEGRS